jgi:hypothetical protein
MSITPKAIQDLLDELEASKQSRSRLPVPELPTAFDSKVAKTALSVTLLYYVDLIQFVKMWLMRRIVALKSRKSDLHQKRHWVCDHIQKQW